MTTLAQQRLDGLLLSDGNLSRNKPSHNARYQQTSRDPAFLDWASTWMTTTVKITGPHRWRTSNYWMLRTPCLPVYSAQADRWYPDGGQKRIPADFVVTPQSMLTAYLGDGCSVATTRAVNIALCGFPCEDVERLICDPLRDLGMRCTVTSRGYVKFYAQSFDLWFDFIGSCPVKEMAYKWKMPEKW